uniref:Uncharacterized protein n=1 Tax=Lepeophtheirus salmonis TaxID=72036 RepID=A0A0K2TSN0_LEPSM
MKGVNSAFLRWLNYCNMNKSNYFNSLKWGARCLSNIIFILGMLYGFKLVDV